ncbi:VOC family protein [Flavihumibacter sediminis]|nr:VOC family protein [Flavihumibacter sediminis]
MDIDHIFIFTNSNGSIADELISFGFTPNESRIHQGQGTTNRTFSFENFYLEIAWAHNAQEIKSDLVKPTGLWQRASYFNNGYSPFGLIIVNNEASDPLFTNAYAYQPEYFEDGMAFDIIQNEDQPNLPWTCRMPFKNAISPLYKQADHKNKIRSLSRAGFEYRDCSSYSYLEQFRNEKRIQFIKSDRTWLTLDFDNKEKGLQKIFHPLQLTINY